jgi:hypothetical protein
MYYAADRQRAESVLRDLRAARAGEQTSTLACLQRLRNEAACESVHDLPRMQAWQSIRRLYDAFKAGADLDLGPQWQDAIAKTTLWRENLR